MNLPVLADFRVIDESDDWLVVDKPAPLIVHPANRKPEPTLLGGVEKLLAFEMENGARPAIVNRLDRETSGLVMVAKHTAAARELGMMFGRREVDKEYLAIVHGWPEADRWHVDAPILRAGELAPSRIWVRQVVHPDGRPSRSSFHVEGRFQWQGGLFALVRCTPETGRMHQLRVHLAHSGHPILGDKLYSGDGSHYLEWMDSGWSMALQQQLHLPRHALHASVLSLSWRGQFFRWQAPLADDMAGVLRGEPIATHPEIVLWNRHD